MPTHGHKRLQREQVTPFTGTSYSGTSYGLSVKVNRAVLEADLKQFPQLYMGNFTIMAKSKKKVDPNGNKMGADLFVRLEELLEDLDDVRVGLVDAINDSEEIDEPAGK